MTRIDVVSKRSWNPLVRLAHTVSRRQLRRDVDPVGVYAHTPGLLMGYGASSAQPPSRLASRSA